MNFGCPTDSNIAVNNGLGNVFTQPYANSTLTCRYQMGDNRNRHTPSF
jgi:hypothetical protein